ncbi:MAG: acetyl-CoA decarbonylase/synthase complex subunit gamma, partial [Promethearchaeota archaeon]
DFKITRIGEDLKFDAIAVRCTSNDPEKFAKTVKQIADTTDLPLILCSWNTDALVKAAEGIKDKKPMLYAATKQNWKQVGECAALNNLPVVCFSTDLEELVSTAQSIENMGVKEIALDSGAVMGEGLTTPTLDRMMKIRQTCLRDGSPVTKYPLVGIAASIWAIEHPKDDDEILAVQYKEALTAIMMMSTDTNLIVIHTGRTKEGIWLPLDLMTYRQNIFQDPRIFPSVDPGLVKIGEPDENAPVFMTSNYRMTKIPVESDIKEAHIDSWLLVVDTTGLGIESAVAGGQMSADKIGETVKELKPFDNVNHRIMIIPGMAARLSGAIEDEADCYVSVGPPDSSGIQRYMETRWKPEEFMKDYNDR